MRYACLVLLALSTRGIAAEPALVDFEESFEMTAVGEAPQLAQLSKGGCAGSIKVTAEAPRSGSRCLKITDGPDVKPAAAPFFHYPARCRDGVARVAFSIRTAPGAVVVHEWHDASQPQKTGPVVRIEAGWITSNGQRLAPMPEGEWVRLEFEMKLGAAADDTFDLTIRTSGEPPERLSELPCADSGVAQIELVRFSTTSSEPSAWWLDDLLIKNLRQMPE